MTLKMIDPAAAANLYAQTSGVGNKPALGNADTASFGSFLKEGIADTIDTLKTGEKMSAMAVTGKADITEVVQAVTAAENSLQMLVALRDRAIGAYQQIQQMPI